ncbi:MAG: DUF4062 domain-containing protein [Longimicrobiaceae bacterium]
MQPPPSIFGPEVLLIFVGHSDDAAAEAGALLEIERDLQRVLEHHLEVANGSLPFKTVRLWEWTRDARAGIGGQERVIAPAVLRANVAVFVFKERIGKVTWAELENARDRAIPVLSFFPAIPPEGKRLMEPSAADAWAELLKRKKELTADWDEPGSRSVTPMDDYDGVDHLKERALAAIEGIVASLLRFPPSEAPAAAPPPPAKFLGEGEHLSYDRRPVLAHTPDELDPGLLQDFLAQPLSQGPFLKSRPRPTESERLHRLGMVSSGHPTLGAFLCFAPSHLLVDKFDGCSMQLVIYNGTDRASSRPSITPLRDNLLGLLADGMAWLTTQAGLRRRGQVGAADRDELEIPEIVLREVLANALVHRDYETPGLKDQPTRVEVYSDRVEVTSFGILPQSVRIESLNTDPEGVVPYRRNPVVACVFQHMSHVELNASGVPRMRSEMARVGLPPPRFAQNLHDSIIRVVLLRPSEWADAPATPAPTHDPGSGGPRRVFISSTVQDLHEHRRSVADAALRLGFMAVALEALPASDSSAVEYALDEMDKADVYIGIFAHRYGYVPAGQDLSLAELEYDRAGARGIPRLLFLMHDDHPVRPSDVEAGPGAARLKALKERIRREHLVTYFRSPEDLRSQVIHALAGLRNDLPARQTPPRALAPGTELPSPPEPYVPHPYTHAAWFVGRRAELELLTEWLDGSGDEASGARIYCLVGLGGMGKTSLAWEWFTSVAPRRSMPLAGRLWWSFYETPNFDEFLTHALAYVTRSSVGDVQRMPEILKERQLLQKLDREPFVLVLDGLERLLAAYAPTVPQARGGTKDGQREMADPHSGIFFSQLAGIGKSRVLATTRLLPAELEGRTGSPIPGVHVHLLGGLADKDVVSLLKTAGAHGPDDTLTSLSHRVENHPLTLQILAGQVAHYRKAPGDVDEWLRDHPTFELETAVGLRADMERILRFALRGLDETGRSVLVALSARAGPVGYEALSQSLVGPGKRVGGHAEFDTILGDLEDRGLIAWDRSSNRYDMHPVVRAAVLHWEQIDYTRLMSPAPPYD